MSCAEQSASRVMAMAMAGGAEEQVALGQAIGELLDRQRYDGAFSLWSSGGEADPWVSAYAAEVLLRNADTAMYRAKQLGKRRSVVFESHMHTASFDRLELRADLARAIETD